MEPITDQANDVEMEEGFDFEEKKVEHLREVKAEMDEVVEVEIADPLGLDGDQEESRFSNEAHDQTSATLAETVFEAGDVNILEKVRVGTIQHSAQLPVLAPAEVIIVSNDPIQQADMLPAAEVEPGQQVVKSLEMGNRQVVISLEQSEASREVLVEEEVVREEKAMAKNNDLIVVEGTVKDKNETCMTNSTETRDKDKHTKDEHVDEGLTRGKRLYKSHRFNKMKTKEMSKYRMSSTLEKSISKKHSLSLSLRKAVLEKLEKQKELLALREAQKRKSEQAIVVKVGATDSVEVEVEGPSKVGPEIEKENIEENCASDLKANKQSNVTKNITKESVEPKVDLKCLIKSLVTTKSPDSETIKKIVSRTRLDLRNREETVATEKRKLEKREEGKKKCRYCKDEGWGEVIGCDFCSSSYHPVCLDLGPPELKLVLALSHWKCPECIEGAKEAPSSTRVTSKKSLQDVENISRTESLKRRAETAKVEVKVTRLKLNMKEKEMAGKVKTTMEEKERLEVQEKGREGLQEQVRCKMRKRTTIKTYYV